MAIIKEYANMVTIGITSILMWLLGGFDVALQVLFVMLILDYVTGILVGYKQGTLSSKRGKEGILKKIGIICCVIVAVLADKVLGTDQSLRSAIIICFIGNEGISVLENATNLGVPIPQKLTDALLQLKGKDENNK